jgi:hypothetical protein
MKMVYSVKEALLQRFWLSIVVEKQDAVENFYSSCSIEEPVTFE